MSGSDRIWASTRRVAEGKYRVLGNRKPTDYFVLRNDNAEPGLRWAVEREGDPHPLHENATKRDALEWIENLLNGGKRRWSR